MNVNLRDELYMEDGIVLRIKRTVVEAVPLEALVSTLANMTRNSCRKTPLLPGSNGSCRLYAETEKYIGFLIQCNPSVWSIRFNHRKKENMPTTVPRRDPEDPETFLYDISVPWLWILCRFWRFDDKFQWNECYMAATYTNIERMDDKVYFSPIPNIWDNDSRMCTNELTKHDEKPTDAPGLMCRKFLYKLPQCYFNDDLKGAPAYSVKRELWADTLFEWDAKTVDNPGFALDPHFGMIPYGTLEEFINNSMEGEA